MAFELHEVVFRWPHTEPKDVIVTGSFDDWAKSIHLKPTPTGFETRVRLPYSEKTPYKFIVDGTWLVDEANPTEYDNIGNLNNVYDAPAPPPPTKVTPPTTPVVVGGFESSKEAASPAKAPQVANGTTTANGGANGKANGYFPKTDSTSETKSGSRLSLSDFANTVAAREGTTSAYEYVKSGLGAVISGIVGTDPINAGQVAIPTPNTAQSFNTMIPPTSPSANATSDADAQKAKTEPEIAPNVPIAIVPVNSAENNTIITSNGDAKEPDHTHSPVVSPVKPTGEVKELKVEEPTETVLAAPEVPSVEVLPVADKETSGAAEKLPEAEATPAAVEAAVPDVVVSAPEVAKEETAPVAEEVLGKAVPTPTGPVVPPEAQKEEAAEVPVPAAIPAPAPVESAAETERPSTPVPAAAAPAAPSTPSKSAPAPTASAPSTPLSVKKGSSGSHFKRGSLSGTFGSIRGKKEGSKAASKDDSSSSSSDDSSSVGVGKDGKKKKKKRESIFGKIKRVFSPHHHHDHHHHHQHQDQNGQNGEKKVEGNGKEVAKEATKA